MPNELKTELVKNLQGKRGCFWMDQGLVVWDGPNNKGAVMLSKSSIVPFELDPDLEGTRLMRFTTRRMKRQFIRQCSRRFSKAVWAQDLFVELPAAVFDEENPDMSEVQDGELKKWLRLL